jgi:uncharacterized protein YheU (UPF0270 family)
MNIVVPYERLRPETLQALVEEFVTREGAVHGHADALLANQIAAVRDQLRSGRVVITFDEETESCTICSADKLRRVQADEGGADPGDGAG